MNPARSSSAPPQIICCPAATNGESALFVEREQSEPIDQNSEAKSKMMIPISVCRVAFPENCNDGINKIPTPTNPPASASKTGNLGRSVMPVAHDSSTI